MPLRLVALNLNHRTHAKALPAGLLPALGELAPDVLVLCEYVEGNGRPAFHAALANGGLRHIAVSDTVNYAPRRWHNQILIASRFDLAVRPLTDVGPEACCAPNYLAVRTGGVNVTGVRAPAYTRAGDWYAYWAWLTSVVDADVTLGDFNTDPRRPRKWDRVLADLARRKDGTIVTPEDGWSFRHARGAECRIDHALVRNGTRATHARYVTTPFVPDFTDHAALVVEIEPDDLATG